MIIKARRNTSMVYIRTWCIVPVVRDSVDGGS